MADLASWLTVTVRNISFEEMIQEYLLGLSQKLMSECVGMTNSTLQVLAATHDWLGWDNFVEGRICKMYLSVVKDILITCITPESWGRTFVTKLMHMTHRQCLYCNTQVHYTPRDGLATGQRDQIFARVEELMMTDPDELLACHQHLLHENFKALGEGLA